MRLSSIIDIKPSASFGPMVSITLSPIIIPITPDCTMYMQFADLAAAEDDAAGRHLDGGTGALGKGRMSMSPR